MAKKSLQLMESHTKDAINACLKHFFVDPFLAPRRNEMTIEQSTSNRYMTSRPSPHITFRRLRMITKESINGEDFFAVDEPPNQGCDKCVFESLFCAHIRCTSARRDDNRDVFFLPIYDLKTLAAYRVQEAAG